MRALTIALTVASLCFGAAWAQQVVVLPQIADGVIAGGLRFTAQIEIESVDSTEFTASVEFFGTNGQPVAFDLQLLPDGSASELNSKFQFRVPPMSLRALRGGKGNYPARAAWCRVTTGGAKVSVTYRLEAVAATDSVFPTMSTKHSIPPMTQVTVLRATPYERLVMPIVQDIGGAQLGIAVANNSTRTITGTGTVYNENGQIVGTFPIEIVPTGQLVRFLNEVVQLPANFRGLLHIAWTDSAVPGWGLVVGLVLYSNGTLATVPVVRAGTSTGTATTADVFPHTADGQAGGFDYIAQIVVGNGDTRDLDVKLEFIGSDGNPLPFSLEVVGVSGPRLDSVFQVTVPAKGVRVLRGGNSSSPAQSAWVRLTRSSNFLASQVDFIVVPRAASTKIDGVPLTQVSVQRAATSGIPSMSIIQDTGGGLGFAIANNNSSRTVSGTATIHDENAQVVGSFTVSVGPLGRLVSFLNEKLQLPEHFRGVLRFRWPDFSGPAFDQAGFVVGLVQYPNGVLAAVP